MSAIQEAVRYKEALRCIREVMGSIHLGVEYTHKQYHDTLNRIQKLVDEVGL